MDRKYTQVTSLCGSVLIQWYWTKSLFTLKYVIFGEKDYRKSFNSRLSSSIYAKRTHSKWPSRLSNRFSKPTNYSIKKILKRNKSYQTFVSIKIPLDRVSSENESKTEMEYWRRGRYYVPLRVSRCNIFSVD